MNSLSAHVQAFVAPIRGGSAAERDMRLPRTTQDLELEETGRRTQASGSKPTVTLIDTTIASKFQKDTPASPFSGSTLNGDGLGEPSEKQQDDGSSQESKNADKEEGSPVEYPKYPIIPRHCRRWEKPEPTVIKRGTIPAGPLHLTNPVPTLPEGWVEHTHLEGKLYYVRDASKSNAIQGALTIVTDSDPRNQRNLLGLESVHRQVVEAIKEQDMPLPEKVQLFIQLYPEQDESWGHVGGYYLADLDNQSVFWVEPTNSLYLGLGENINFGVFGEQHLKLTLHRQFWYHIECYPLPGSIDEAKEHEILLKHLTFAMLDVSTSPTSTSTYTASECSAFIGSIDKTPENSRTWPIARIAGFMAEHRFTNYYGHPSARLSHLHAFEVEHTEGAAPASDAPAEQTEGDAPASDASAEQPEGVAPASDASAEQTEGTAPASDTSAEHTPDQSTQRQRFGGLWLRATTLWYTMVAIWLRLCSIFLFDSPIRHHTALEDLFVDKIVYQRNYKRIMKALQDDWSDASLLATVLFTANMAYLAIPPPPNTTYTTGQLSLLQIASNTCSLFSTVFSIGSITLGLINTRHHRGESPYNEIAEFLQGAHHHHYGFRPLAIVYALPIALLMWAVLSFAGAIALYCLMATTIIPRVAVLALGTFLIACTLVTIWYFWQRETRWGYDVEGVSPKREQRLRFVGWLWDLTHISAKH